MKAQLKPRPQSKRIRVQSASTSKRNTPKAAQQYFQKAKQYQLNQNYDRAIELYMIATKCKPNYFQAFCNMGYCYRIQGKFIQAKKCYLNSILSNPQDSISHYNLANIYRINGENQLAIDEYSCVIKLKQQKDLNIGNLYINSLINIGICYKNKGYIQDAINVNRKVLEINPEEESGIFNLAICLLNSIQTKNSRMFNKFYHQRALEAEKLFERVMEKSGKNYMVQLSMLKISVILNPLSENIQKVIEDLKQLHENSDCNIHDEINEEIAHCLNLLKKYDESARYYQDSMGKMTRRASANSQRNQRKKSDNLIVNIFSQFQDDGINQIDILKMVFITESEVINLMESGNIKFVKEKISELNEGTTLKHILQIILYLYLYEDDENYLYLAAKIYEKHFNNSQKPVPFDAISLQGHKAIGKLLNLQGKFEESIAHYQYISQSLKDNRTCASAKLHNDLGQRYQQAGNRKKALQQYKTGIDIEPENYTLTYNLGYCLYDGGNYDEAAESFKKIIERVKNDDNFKPQTKNLYITDCMIILALCLSEQSRANDVFQQAFTRFDTLRKTQTELVEMDEQTLLLFFVNVSEIYEQKLEKSTFGSKDWTELSKKLISIYQYLLQLKTCPDRDEIYFNTGNLNYQIQNYVSAIYFYSQISRQSSPPLINIALSYAHILQPVMALKYITEACTHDPHDLINNVCREMMEWMFMNRRNGDWNKYMPTFKEDLFYQRQQYGLIIIDKISEFISDEQNEKVHTDTLKALIKRHVEIKSKKQLTNIKFTKLSELSEKYNFTSTSLKESNILSEQVLKMCFIKSSNIETDLRALIRHLSKILPCGKQSQFCQAALYLFIYTNQVQSQEVQAALKKIDSKIVQRQSFNTPGFIEENEDIFSILPDFENIKEMVAVLKEWEALLEEKISSTLRTVQKTYYQGRNGTPLQFQYNFPRHCNLNQTDETFEKIVKIAVRALGYDKGLTCRGNTLPQMKDDLIKQFQIHFNRYLKGSKLKPVTISQKFRPISLYASHNTKQQAQQFLTDLSKKLQIPKITISHDCKQLQLTINKLIWIQCHWQSPYSNAFILKEVVQHIVQNPLFIVNQAVLYLQSAIPNIRKDSQSAKKYISKDAILKF